VIDWSCFKNKKTNIYVNMFHFIRIMSLKCLFFIIHLLEKDKSSLEVFSIQIYYLLFNILKHDSMLEMSLLRS
jgi:hypothetical protein